MSHEDYDIRDDLAAYLDGELDAAARARVEARVAEDASLRAELEALREVDARYGALPGVNAPANFEALLWERLEDERAAAEPIRLATRRRQERPRRVWPLLMAAAVMAMLGGIFVPYYLAGSPERFDIATSKQTAPARDEDEVIYEIQNLVPQIAPVESAPVPEPAPTARERSAERREQMENMGYIGVEAPPAEAMPSPPPPPPAAPVMSRPAPKPTASAPPPPPLVAAPDPESVASSLPPASAPVPPRPESDAAQPEEEAKAMAIAARESFERAGRRYTGRPGLAEVSVSPEADDANGAAASAFRRAKGLPRVFRVVAGVYIQDGYQGEPYTQVSPDADVVTNAIDSDALLRAYVGAKESVLFEAGDAWYRVDAE